MVQEAYINLFLNCLYMKSIQKVIKKAFNNVFTPKIISIIKNYRVVFLKQPFNYMII